MKNHINLTTLFDVILKCTIHTFLNCTFAGLLLTTHMTVGGDQLRTPNLDPNFTPPRMPSQAGPPMHPMDRDPNMM